MSVDFKYGIWNNWLHCRLDISGSQVAHTVAGFHDGDRELIDAAKAMFGRATTAEARFEEEPGEFRWRIDRLEVNRIRIRILKFDDFDLNLPDEKGRLLFDGTCGVVSFAQAIHDGFCAWINEVQSVPGNRCVVDLKNRVETLRECLRHVQYK